jgi:hypothetical protein
MHNSTGYRPGLLAGKSTMHNSTGYVRSESGVYYQGSGTKNDRKGDEDIEMSSEYTIWKRTDIDMSTRPAGKGQKS